MSNNSYNDFKQGVKNDVTGLAHGLFAGVGLFLFILTVAGILIWFFLKENHYSVGVKSTVGITAFVLVLSMLLNRQIGNVIYLLWLRLLLLIFILFCLSCIGVIFYVMYTLTKDSF